MRILPQEFALWYYYRQYSSITGLSYKADNSAIGANDWYGTLDIWRTFDYSKRKQGRQFEHMSGALDLTKLAWDVIS